MRKVILISAAFLVAQHSAYSQQEFRDLVFSAMLDGQQEVQELNGTVNGRGVAGLVYSGGKMYVNITVNGLSGPITNAHIHEGRPGESGSPVYPLGDFIDGTKIRGEIDGIDLSSPDLEKFIRGDYYINIHTDANPGGEIRGQVRLENDRNFVAFPDREQAGITATPMNHVIEVADFSFTPPDLTINLGDTVTFKWVSGFHTSTSYATSGPDAWDHQMSSSTDDFKLVLKAPGDHDYYCLYHEASGMKGVIRVNAAPAGLASFTLSQDSSSLEMNALIVGMTNTITNAHLHWGSAGVSGSPAIGVFDLLDGNIFRGTLDLNTLSNRDVFIDSLMNEALYLNIHTDAYPGGELRGQVSLGPAIAWDAWLGAGDEVSGVDAGTPEGAVGLAIAGYDPGTDTLGVEAMLDGLSGAVTAAHFHQGAAGSDGSPIVNLSTQVAGNRISARIVPGGDEFLSEPDFNDVFESFLDREIYLNVHTALNPGGEVRGQMNGTYRTGVVFDLCSGQVTDELSGNAMAYGTGLVTIGRRKKNLHYLAAVSGMTSEVSAAHIHQAVAGESGAPVFPLETDSVIAGYWGPPSFTGDFPGAFESGEMYFMFHTVENPSGEARGQVAYGVSCDQEDNTGLLPDVAKGGDITLYPNPAGRYITVSLPAVPDHEIRVEIRNMLGQEVYSNWMDRGRNRMDLDVGSLPGGVYLVRITGHNTTLFRGRFIKN